MANTINTLTIQGFKSIRKLEDFPLRALNVLIGPNGAGKSNFVSFFRLLRNMIDQQLQIVLASREGGADACLYLGPSITNQFSAKLQFGNNGYEFSLLPTPDNRFVFSSEETLYFKDNKPFRKSLGSGHYEAKLKARRQDSGAFGAPFGVPSYVFEAISDWVVYHFHDTSLSAAVRRAQYLNDNEVFRQDAANLASFLYRIRQTHTTNYEKIRDIVRLAAPFFDDFHLRPIPTNTDQIQLEWRQRGSSYPFRAHQLSDGTLRFICLATALLQPFGPSTVLFDEPELGLHPYALTLLGNLFKQTVQSESLSQQIIISTQSSLLLNEFAPEDVVIVERSSEGSIFRRLDSANLSEWLNDYSLGELWQKNVFGGRPVDDPITQPIAIGDGHR